MSDIARQSILNRIDSAMGPPRNDHGRDWERISRSYIRTDSLSSAAILELFKHRLEDYGAQIFRSTHENLQETIAHILLDRNAKQMLIPADLPAEWLPSVVKFTVDNNLTYEKLNRFDGVLTAATVAVAATGSIVLQHGEGEGRRALTLIPDYHLCIVKAEQVVQTVPAAMGRLDKTRPTTFISGPSATADIEMTRIKGVHGPRFMDVVLLQQ